eukprot:TRINITY_DN15626_c0_g1_i1.p1 TRINITY_DN15626_c0_g1~~TRINITY_DN15626_c0_g1_i1.p1  ORF type:complete len:317 (+),score=61.72 TRINITY_DN15626_c0_g1_i1:308-1258(+)
MVNSDVQQVFARYCGTGATDMDGRGFIKLCRDCGLLANSSEARDADLAFVKAAAKGRRLGFAEFERALTLMAERRGSEESSIFAVVGDAGQPTLNGTRAEPVRLHDDKGTYTGVHGHMKRRPSSCTSLLGRGKPGSAVKVAAESLLRPPTPELRTRSSSRTPSEITLPSRSSPVGSRTSSPSNESLGTVYSHGHGRVRPLEIVFDAYCGTSILGMDGKSFAKLMKDSCLIDRQFSVADTDIAFTRAVTKGQRRIDLQGLKTALLFVADKKGIEAGDVFAAVAGQALGPHHSGTKAEPVRFHDDLSTYTGVHAGGGP